MRSGRPHLVHVFPGFGPGGSQVRTTQVINSAPGEFRHTIVALDGALGCAARLGPRAETELIDLPGRVPGAGTLSALRDLLPRLRPDLLLTYNWGSVEAIVAARSRGVRRILHAEDGFNDDEAGGQVLRRVVARRVLLRAVSRVIVPSRTLERLARRSWWLPERRIVHLPNGVDTEHFSPVTGEARREVRERLGIDAGEIVVGTVCGLASNKNVELLVRAVARLAAEPRVDRGAGVRLLLVGDGPRRPALRELSRELGIDDRTIFAGRVDDPVDHYRAMDLFALTSRTEQMPLAVLEAMAVGLPVVATDVGDVATMVAAEGRHLVVGPGDLDAVAGALERLLGNRAERDRLGRLNRRRCLREYDLAAATERYRRLYRDALSN